MADQDRVGQSHAATIDKDPTAIAVTDRPAPQAALREPDLETVCAEVARLGGEQTGPAGD